jgi:phosphatidylglycerophosphate synthase
MGLARARVSPNGISSASVVFSVLVPVGLLSVGGVAGALLALAGIQLRLLCNVWDGLVALEGGLRSATGDLFNELPDRVSDSIILVTFGYAATMPAAGWLAALLAALTAYIRVYGGALGLKQSFAGPMAKQHRMAVCSLLAVLLALPIAGPWKQNLLSIGLGVIILGSLLTCVMRTRRIAGELKARFVP